MKHLHEQNYYPTRHAPLKLLPCGTIQIRLLLSLLSVALIYRKIRGGGRVRVRQVKPSNCFRRLDKLVLPSILTQVFYSWWCETYSYPTAVLIATLCVSAVFAVARCLIIIIRLVWTSVSPSVCHVGGLYPDGWRYCQTSLSGLVAPSF